MDVLKTAKELASLLQKMGNIDMLRQMVALQGQVAELVEENRRLKEQAAHRSQADFRENAYWVKGDGPYCSCCFDSNAKLVRLHKRSGHHPQCPVCKAFAYVEEPPKAVKPVARQRPFVRSRYLDRD